jgi:hypothetical protein
MGLWRLSYHIIGANKKGKTLITLAIENEVYMVI